MGLCISRSNPYTDDDLIHAVLEGKTNKVRKLIGSVNVNAKKPNGDTALHIAVERGYEDIARILLDFKADVNSVNILLKQTPIHFAVERGSGNIVNMLIDKGADVNVKDMDGETPLHKAALCGREKIVENLLDFNADPNAKCGLGLPPLLYAINYECKDVFRLLLEYSADFTITNTNGNSILDTVPYVYHDYSLKKLIKEHITKLHVAGLYLSEKNIQSIRNDPQSSYETECKNEIDRMKSKIISDTNVSFYDILIKPRSMVAAFSKDSIILQVMNSGDYRTEFPKYASLINRRFKIAKERGKLEEQLYQHFRSFDHFSKLPHECILKIFDYLKNEELRNLIEILANPQI